MAAFSTVPETLRQYHPNSSAALAPVLNTTFDFDKVSFILVAELTISLVKPASLADGEDPAETPAQLLDGLYLTRQQSRHLAEGATCPPKDRP